MRGPWGVFWRSAHVPTIPFTWLRRAKALGHTAHAVSRNWFFKGQTCVCVFFSPCPPPARWLVDMGHMTKVMTFSMLMSYVIHRNNRFYCLSRHLIGWPPIRAICTTAYWANIFRFFRGEWAKRRRLFTLSWCSYFHRFKISERKSRVNDLWWQPWFTYWFCRLSLCALLSQPTTVAANHVKKIFDIWNMSCKVY